jgi:hypothetical protein
MLFPFESDLNFNFRLYIILFQNNNFNLKLTKLLIMDPVKRITCQVAMDDQYFKDEPKPSDE